MTALTRDAAGHLAEAIARLRPDWQAPGILAALEKAVQRPDRPDAWQTIIATARAAAEPTNRTPAVIALDGQHWRPAHPDEAAKVTPTAVPLEDVVCGHCGRLKAEGDIEHRKHCGRVAEPERVHSLADAARAAIQPTTTYEAPTEETP
jgi:hypothetical protein